MFWSSTWKLNIRPMEHLEANILWSIVPYIRLLRSPAAVVVLNGVARKKSGDRQKHDKVFSS